MEKAEDAKRAMVVGDFMAGALAKGLAEAYAENPNVVVIDATSGSSGLVRNDYYDWPAKLPALVEEQKPDAILVMIGGNDRQGIETDTGAQALGSEAWRAAYAARVAAFADALKATGKPVLWGGLVPVAPAAMSRDYSSFNGIVREQLEAKGAELHRHVERLRRRRGQIRRRRPRRARAVGAASRQRRAEFHPRRAAQARPISSSRS